MRIIIKLSLFLGIFSWCSIQTNPNFKTRHKAGVVRHNYKLVGQWHIEFIEKSKSADWFLYRQIEERPEGIAVRYKIVIVNQQDYMITSSRPFPVTVTKKRRPDKSVQIHTIMLGNVFKLDVVKGTLYERKDKVIGYITK